ncbi:MAG: hypothetical protein K0U86_06760 [Planctomycetes bacterium]|nr:hypothetical protein [Planctomycetota bacterium]MCH9724589.1 hypothetical protein [Planctomycetota bacterium]MCH9777878.1 hypothetical protein [Planctomycetota bacterium]
MNAIAEYQVETKLTELNLVLSPDINYRLETMFPKITGMFANGAIKRKFKLVQRIEPLMEEMLLDHEEVLFVSKGNQSCFVEQFFMGGWVTTINHTVVILTNLRLLCIRTNGSGKPKRIFWSIYYSQIKELKSTILGNAKICLKDGKNLNYSGIPDIDRKTMRKVFLDAYQLFEEKGFDPSVSQSQENLCSHCYSVVSKNKFECQCCGATFWKPMEIGVRSFILPSWGNFVMKHYPLANTFRIGFMLALLFFSITVVNGNHVFAFLLFLMLNANDAAITARIAAKGLHLKAVPEHV